MRLRSQASKPNANGRVIYRGPSLIDGTPIVVIVTGLTKGSTNGKTGRMLQTFVMVDTGEAPTDALKSGADSAICGNCPHKPTNAGSCYVNVGRSVSAVWRCLWQGAGYGVAANDNEITALGRGHYVRLGTYGDPAAVPQWVWDALVSESIGWNGYTHQWRIRPDLMRLCMASVDSEAEAAEARALGWRTFRVRAKGADKMRGEFVCGASEEAGRKLTCVDCQACGGTGAKAKASPVIIAHGATARRFALYVGGRLAA